MMVHVNAAPSQVDVDWDHGGDAVDEEARGPESAGMFGKARKTPRQDNAFLPAALTGVGDLPLSASQLLRVTANFSERDIST
jgi:hypothetical protein